MQGKKVLLRPVKGSDISCFLKWFNDHEVTQYLGNTYSPMTEMSEEKRIADVGATKTDAVLVIEAIDGEANKSIGTIGLRSINPKDHYATFGIAIGDKDYWSKGYGTEAARLMVKYGFEELNLHRINSFAIGFNERSIRMHKAVGFKEEGCQREMIFKKGQFRDHVVFGLLRSEWEAKNGRTRE